MLTRLTATATILAAFVLSGCTSPQHGYSTSLNPSPRDTHSAQRLNDKGLGLLDKDDAKGAEEAFRDALRHDLFYAPAHNNLGLLLFRQSKAYEAAWEFQFAARLAPYAVEPRNNLGLVLERVGRSDQAVEHFESALDIDPHNVQVMGHLAKSFLKSGEAPEKLDALLARIVLERSDGEWNAWARRQLLARELERQSE